MKNAIIHIAIKNNDLLMREVTESELTTTGSFGGDAADYQLAYLETGDELQGCMTTLRVEQARLITMARTGAYTAALTIELNRRHNCLYGTPFGEMMMGFYGRSIRSEMTADGGTLAFDYTIDLNNSPFAEVSMEITVRCKEE